MSEPDPPATPPADEPPGPPPPWESVLRPEVRARLLSEHFMRYSRTHTFEALGRAALSVGYTPEEVAAAGASVEARLASGEASPGPRSAAANGVAILLIIVAVLAYGGAIIHGLAGAAFEAGGSYLAGGGSIAILWLILYRVAMLVGGIYSIRRLWRAPSASSAGTAVFVALALSVGIFGGLSGICTVGLSNMHP